jgi:hypothetical protein
MVGGIENDLEGNGRGVIEILCRLLSAAEEMVNKCPPG